jgi:hypothetical protein
MSLTMKDRYARLDLSKLPESYKSEFDEMEKSTSGFSDEDLNEIFKDNFNDMYSLVEKKYPDAISTGKPIKKVKPAKVKTIKAKPSPQVKVPAAMRKKLSQQDIIFIEDQLTNDESSTDEEMIEHFAKETGMTEAQAKKWVALRTKYMTRMSPEESLDYPTRTGLKKQARKDKDSVTTRDGHTFIRKDKKNEGKKFYDENGKQWTCKGYNAKLDECIFEDSDKKQISSCLRDMYVHNPIEKREKGNLVDECKEELKKAGYKVVSHTAGGKKVKRSEPRPDRAIIKERVQEAFVPITKDLASTEEKKTENKELISLLEDIQGLFSTFLNRIYSMADDNKIEQLKKVKKLLKEIVE